MLGSRRRQTPAAIPVHFCTDIDLTRLYADGNTLFFLADHPSDTNKSSRCPLHAMDTATGKILWTHLVNRQAQFLDNWTTDELLVTPTAVYYTNNSLSPKLPDELGDLRSAGGPHPSTTFSRAIRLDFKYQTISDADTDSLIGFNAAFSAASGSVARKRVPGAVEN